jgi:hypothetical protein
VKQTATIHYLLISAYFAISLAGIMHHELWLDESHHWLLARDSESIGQLWTNTRYEGHPLLWNVLLYCITRVSLNPIWMQLLHVCISTAAVAVFVRKAPLNMAVKSLFIFGYFMLFEYNLISRNYSLGVLFLFVCCALFERRREKFILFSLCLALLANTHSMFGVIAVALFITALIEDFRLEKKYLIGCSIFLVGLLVALIQILPPADSHFLQHAAQAGIGEKFIKGFVSLFKGLFAIPNFTNFHFWNSNLFVAFSKPLASVLALLAYGIPLLLFQNRKTLFFVYLGLFGAQVFFYLTQLGATRYDGMTYLIVIAALWIDKFYRPPVYAADPIWKLRLPVLRPVLLYLILVLQFCSGIAAYAADYRFGFTGSKAAAELFSKNIPDSEMASVSCEGTIVAPYINKRLLFLCDGQHHSFCHWQSANCGEWDETEILTALSTSLGHSGKIGFVCTHELKTADIGIWEKANPRFKFVFIGRTARSIIRYNAFYVYEMVKLQ